MSSKKKTATTADGPPHRYPTRSKLRQPPHDHCYPRYLPIEVIFNILIFIPGNALFHVMRYVCKQWYDIIRDPDFVRLNSRMSTPGFLIQETDCPHSDHNHVIHIDADTPTLNDATEIQIPSKTAVVSCFNGLVLLTNSSNRKIFHVANPMTKENISLPPLKGMSTAGIAVDSTGCYKVVCASGASRSYNKQVKLRVFTIGIDKGWRSIDLQGIQHVNSEMRDAMSYCPQTLGGFIYWWTHYYHTTSRRYGFALDIETETIYQFSEPEDVVKTAFAFISMGTNLGFIASGRGCTWRVWKLTDVKSGEWTELASINVSTLCSRYDEVLDPYVNLLYQPVKLFGGRLWFYCDIKDGSALARYKFGSDNLMVFRIKRRLNYRILLSHANTLISPKNL
ncbi:putative F-box protein At1g19160 [Silene latifolia]|uniref:putative F-box protein At1g19160 n=1 Tax=Silene latifolia TaxID=37657 RepID=UPI003D77C08D